MNGRNANQESLTAELSALAAVGRALDALDPATRARVLRWANDRYNGNNEGARPAAPAGDVRAVPAADTTLAVDSLEDMFEVQVHRESLEVDAADFFERAPARIAPPPGPQPTESLLKAFVAEFQQLVVEWQGA